MKQEEHQGKSNRGVLGSLTLSHLSQHFYNGAPILFQNVREDLGLSYFDIGLVNSASNILGGFLQIAYSLAARRYKRRILLGGANLAMSLGCLMMGLANGFLSLFTGNVVAGAGQAGMHPMGTSIIADKFDRKKVAGALSLFYGLGYIGNIISPILLSVIGGAIQPQGWRFSFYVLALVPSITGLIVILYLRGEPAGDKIELKATQESFLDSMKSALKIRSAVYVLAAQSFIAGGTNLVIVTTWVPLFLRDPSKGLGLDLFQTGLISALSTGGGVIGTILIGHIADRIGQLKAAIASTAGTVILVYLMSYYTSFTPIIIPHLFFLGVTTFSIGSLLQAHITIVSTPSQREALLGLFFTFGFGISSVWSALLGGLIDIYSFNAAWIGMSSLGVIALLMLIGAYRNTGPLTQEPLRTE